MTVAAPSAAPLGLGAPRVTVLVPARNEAGDIAACIDAIAAQDLPLEQLEVIVVDGRSSDATVRIAEEALAAHPFGAATVVVNEVGSTPSNLNLGLGLARGDVLCRVDARSRIPTDYVRRCTQVMDQRSDIAVVGGSQVAVVGFGPQSTGIARALNNPLGMGLARYRSGRPSGTTDTVYLGFFRTDELRAAGGWDETWATNQDFELNRRMSTRGLVWFEADLPVGYVPRPTVRALACQYHRFGRWKVRYWRISGDRPQPRQIGIIAGGLGGSVAAAVAFVRLAATPRRLVVAVVIGLVGAGAVEARSTGPGAGLRDRVTSILASGAVAGGWLSGIVREAVRPGEPPATGLDR